MVYWLIAIISAYIFFGLSSLCDKLVLAGKVQKSPQPNSYAFYVGVSSILAIFLIPFTKFCFPNSSSWIWIIMDAAVYITGLYVMFVALEKFDVSRVIATIGATQPIFIFILTWVFFGAQDISGVNILAFVMLFLGSAIISVEKNIEVTGDYLKITLFSSLMFSLDYIFSKHVFLGESFLNGLIWVRIFIFLFALIFLFTESSRREIFSKQMVSNKNTQLNFILAQTCGGAGNFLQSFGISLVPVAFLAIANSLRGIQYVFLFFITIFVSLFYPKILHEKMSVEIILQKTISIVLIAIGLAMLVS